MRRPRRLLTVSHSYVVAQNRRLAHEMAKAGQASWEVVAAAPSYFRGDLRPVHLEDFEGEECDVRSLSVYGSFSPHLFLYSAQLRALLREKWDFIHCWEEPFVMAGVQVAAWTPKKAPLVFASFQNQNKKYPPPFRQLEAFAMRRAQGCVALGHTVGENLASRGNYRGKRVKILTVGVDVEHFRPRPQEGAALREKLGFNHGQPVVGFLGRFVEAKGVGVLQAALDRVQLPWCALFVGGGPLEGALQQWAKRYPGRVQVVTDVSHDEVPQYLNAMDVLCAPSQTTRKWKEQFGRMLAEGFACGTPVIGSNSGEIPHTLGDAGVVVPEADVAQWAASISNLLDSPAKRSELSARGRERALSEFAWPVVAERHLSFFEEVLSDAPPS